jgi:hypothetical protein
MKRDEFHIHVAASNGRPQRMVDVEHLTRGAYRDDLDTNSAISRSRCVARIAKRFEVDVEDLEWLNDALVEAADDADRRADEDAGDANYRERKNTADLLVELALARYRIGRTDTNEAFAVDRDGPNVAIMFRGSRDGLRSTLARLFREMHGRVPNNTALADALTVLQGEAYEAEPEPVHLRVAEHDDNIVIDLGDSRGQAVIVQPDTWQVVPRSPVIFRRAVTGELPTPVHGGDLAELRTMLNVAADTWPLVLGWLVAALVPNMPHPILLLGGQQGTGMTTAAEQLVSLVDPSPALLRSQPRDPETWALIASASWVVAVDNVSTIPDWWSDSLCKAVTGDGWLRRKLYTDGELAVLSFRRVVLLTSIDPGALRGDLGDRILLVDLEPINDEARSTQRTIETRFRAAQPRLFGAVLGLLAKVWRELPHVDLTRLPRMADFARLLAAMDCVRPDGYAMEVYKGQRERIAESVIESDPVALAIQSLIDDEGEWEGTAGELLPRITPEKPAKGWPITPRSLSGRLTRLMPALDQAGIRVTFGCRRRHGRIILMAQKWPQPTVTTATPSPETPIGGGSEGGDGSLHLPSSDEHTVQPSRLRELHTGRLSDPSNNTF